MNTLGAHLDYTVRVYLRSHGLPEDEAKLVIVPGPQLDQILRHSQADIVSVGAWQSIFAGKIEAEGGVRVLFTGYDVLGPIALGSDAMERAFIDRHPQAVKDFVTASARAADWHPEEAKRLLGKMLAQRRESMRYTPTATPGSGSMCWCGAGRLKPGQFTPEDVETNKYNGLANLAQQ